MKNLTLQLVESIMNEIKENCDKREKHNQKLLTLAKERFECLKEVFNTILHRKHWFNGRHIYEKIPLLITYKIDKDYKKIVVRLFYRQDYGKDLNDMYNHGCHREYFSLETLEDDEKFKTESHRLLYEFLKDVKEIKSYVR